MARKPSSETPKSSDPISAVAQLQDAGMGNMMAMGTAWMEAVGDLGAEVIGFVAERIKEDVKTQHDIVQCKSLADLQHVQAQFMQKALNQYQEETGKLVKLGTAALGPQDGET